MQSVGTRDKTVASALERGATWTAPGQAQTRRTDTTYLPAVRSGIWQGALALPLPAVVFGLVAFGLALRLLAAVHLTPHVDEAASLLAATMVAERGLPILPSGTVYFQGGTLSYLLAPLVALGADTLAELDRLRVVSTLAGAASVPLAFGLARTIGGSARVGAYAALLVALDPIAIQWSAHLRMYALLQPLTLAFAWLVVRLVVDGPQAVGGRRLAGLVALIWALTFTHVGALALLPGAALAIWWAHRRAAWSARVPLLAAGFLGGLAPLTLLLLNRTLGSASVNHGREPTGMTPSFVGDHLLTPRTLPSGAIEVSRSGLVEALPNAATLFWLGPLLAFVTAGLVATGLVVVRSGALDPVARRGVAVLLALGWLPTAVVWFGSAVPRARYLVHVQALGWVVLAVLLGAALGRVDARLRGGTTPVSWRTEAILVLAPAVLIGGFAWRLAHPVVHPDHGAALAYVAERRAPAEPIVVALPAAGYLTPGADEGLVFLAGPADRPRGERLTRLTPEGELTDYWIGVPAITSAAELAHYLATNPDAWIVVDEERLAGDWAYAGPIADVLRAETRLVYEGPGDVLVLRPQRPVAAAGVGP